MVGGGVCRVKDDELTNVTSLYERGCCIDVSMYGGWAFVLSRTYMHSFAYHTRLSS